MTLESLVYGGAFNLASIVADTASTYVAVKRRGINFEKNIVARALFERYGTGSGTVLFGIAATFGTVVGVALTYSLDRFLDIDNSTINFHNAYLFGYGTLRCLASIGNTLYAAEKDSLARTVSYLPRKLTRYQPVNLLKWAISTLLNGKTKVDSPRALKKKYVKRLPSGYAYRGRR